MHSKQKKTSCPIEVRLIAQGFSNLQNFLQSTQINVSRYVHVSNKIALSLIHEMHMRSLYAWNKSTL